MEAAQHPWRRYAALLGQVESIFRDQKERFGELITCKPGCDDCCRAPFRLTPVEAFSLRLALEAADRPLRRAIVRRAEKSRAGAERVFADLPADPALAAGEISRRRLKCPLLNSGGCDLYFARPVTCRLYGLPTSSRGASHTCPRSGFEPGTSYPTVNLDQVAARLEDISRALLAGAGLEIADMAPVTVARALTGRVPEDCRPPGD